jgi:membrane protease YdiL (CAAX protease family)
LISLNLTLNLKQSPPAVLNGPQNSVEVDIAMSKVPSALCQVFGFRELRCFYHSSTFLSCLGIGAAFLVSLPLLVPPHPLPWHRILSMSFLLAVLWQPIVEELLFRGWLQGILSMCAWGQRTFVGVSIANILTSVIFSSAHLATHPLIWACLTFAPSLLFGILRDRSGSVLPPISMHIIYNAGYFLLMGSSSLV